MSIPEGIRRSPFLKAIEARQTGQDSRRSTRRSRKDTARSKQRSRKDTHRSKKRTRRTGGTDLSDDPDDSDNSGDTDEDETSME